MSNLETAEHTSPPSPVFVIKGNTLVQCLDHNSASLVIPEGVEKIGDSAFVDCQKLSSLTFPSTLEVIGLGAFAGCSSLTSLEIPEGVTTLQEGTFMKCESLVSITLPHTVDTLGNQCFMGCTSLTWETLPETVLFLGYQVFSHCHGLTSFTLHQSIQFLGEQVFSYCNSLSTVTILAPLETLPIGTFYCCPSLTEIHLPDTTTKLGDYAFQGCSSLTQIHLPDSITKLGSSLFLGCSSLTQIHLPDSITELGRYLFQGCSSLTQIHLPDTLTSLQRESFQGCSSLTQIHLPDSITELGQSLFQDCSSLETVTLPSEIQTLESFCFQSCTSLQSMVLPDSIQHIKTCVFRFCTSLQEIRLPKDLKSVDGSVFHDCTSLKRIYKEPCATPCHWDIMTLPVITQFDFIDLPVLADLKPWEQYAYWKNHWEGEQHKELTQFLFSQPKWVDYAFSCNFLPLISCLLETVETLSLLQLGDYIHSSVERQSTEITATFLEYRNKHYSPQEVEAYYTRQEMIDCGFVLPTMEEFSRKWHFEIEKESEKGEEVERGRIGTVKIIGYRGLHKEEVIPKVLADGKVIGSFVHGKDLSFSRGLTHLRIDADLWDCDFSFGMYHLQSLEITGTVFGNINCSDLSSLVSCKYEGKGHKDLNFRFLCCDLRTFTVPEGVTKLLAHSFRNCNNLQTLLIPPSVVEIGKSAFDDCGNLTVYGKIASVADTYCKAHGIPFVEMAEENP